MPDHADDRINLRSDTQSLPTAEMLEAMCRARLGDDYYGEDPTVAALEAKAAAILGKEAALFVPSGTMGNLVALLTHANPGATVVLDSNVHIYTTERRGFARIAGLVPQLMAGDAGAIDPDRLAAALDVLAQNGQPAALFCWENTLNRVGGAAVPLAAARAMTAVARKRGVPVHLDGARIFNAAIALDVRPADIAAQADSVMFCLSKGLSCPAGSMLVGDRSFILAARGMRKLLGGAMRQIGVLAAAGIVALDSMIDRLQEDHANARLLAEGVARLGAFSVDLKTVQTNIVHVRINTDKMPLPDLQALLAEHGILTGARPPDHLRFVTYRGITAAQVQRTVATLAHIEREHL